VFIGLYGHRNTPARNTLVQNN